MDNNQRQLDLAAMFKALGDPTRLRIFEFLWACCCPVAVGDNGDVRPIQGRTVGEVCCYLTGDDRVPSTISFHMKELRNARLIRMERRGKSIACWIEPEVLNRLAAYFGGKEPDNGCDACPTQPPA
jgi:ArsR family transcriptional regulator, arsenate/arsenite/antimonite-responsive transcriptional repressor